MKVSHVSLPTQVKKLCSGISAQPPRMLDKTWKIDYLHHHSPIVSPFCKAFFLNHYSNAKYHAPCGHIGNLQTCFFTQNVCCRIFNRKIEKPKLFLSSSCMTFRADLRFLVACLFGKRGNVLLPFVWIVSIYVIDYTSHVLYMACHLIV